MALGQAERATPDEVRNGTTSLFAALNVATGEVIGKCYKRHRQREFLKLVLKVCERISNSGHQVTSRFVCYGRLFGLIAGRLRTGINRILGNVQRPLVSHDPNPASADFTF